MLEQDQCADKTIIETSQLGIAYGGKSAIAGVDMCVCEKNVTAFIGPSGCGKTSVLHSLNRMTDLIPDCKLSGKIMLDGRSIHDPEVDSRWLRQRVGLIFQKPNPFPFSILDNLTLALKENSTLSKSDREQLAEESLKQVGLWVEVKDRLNQSATQLSGGQQQRLCIARALVLKPEVLLMDEPCSALDPLASGLVEDLILEMKGKLSVLVVTHNLAQARRIADDVIFFWADGGAGRLVENASAKQFFEAPRHELAKAYVAANRV